MDASLYQLLQQGATLLTATGYLAHVQRWRYAEAAQAAGLQVWPTPRIVPWSTYLKQACQQQRNLSARHRLLGDTEALVLWQRIVAESDVQGVLLNPLEAGRSAQRSWQLLHQYQLSLSKVSAWPSVETQTFCAWAGKFVAMTAEHGWLDGARFAGFLHDSAFKPDTPLVLQGFDLIPPDIAQLLQHWRDQGVTIDVLNPAQAASAVRVVSCQDADAELTHAAHWARQQCERGVQRIAVVVPDLSANGFQVKRRFTAVFAPGQGKVNDTDTSLAFQLVATPPLTSYPLVDHALSVLTLLQGRADVLLVGQVLRCPFLQGFDDEAAARARADLIARASGQETWSGNDLARLAGLQQCPQLAACWQSAHRYAASHDDKALPSQWTEHLTQLLTLTGFARGRTFSSAEQQTFHKLQQMLTELGALDEVLGKVTLQRALVTLRHLCQAEHFAPESSDQVVTVTDANSIAGLGFEALWVMGLTANEWPPAPEPDVFLPIELQREAGMPKASAAGCLHAARHTLQRLVGCATDVVLSWPQQDDEVPLVLSPLLREYAASAALSNDQLTPLRATQLFNARPLLNQLVDDRAPIQHPGSAKGGTRIIELQSRCAFRAQAELRLGAVPMPQISIAVEPTQRGQLVHRTLTEVWQRLKDSTGLQAADMEQLREQVAGMAHRFAQQVISGSSVHRRRLAEMEARLCTQWVMQLLQLERLREPFAVLRAEQTEVFELAGLRIRMQLDRLDQLASGGKLLIDYKTGVANHINDWLDNTVPGRPRSPQLPVYALAQRDLAGLAFAVLAPGKAEFRGLSNQDDIAPGITDYTRLRPASQIPGVTEWSALLAHWQQVMTQLAQQYLAGVANVAPLNNECTYCHLHGLCRVHEVNDSSMDEPNIDEQEDSDELA